MPQADNVLKFPPDDFPTDIHRMASASSTARTYALTLRLEGLEALVALAKSAAFDHNREHALAFMGIELMLNDMRSIMLAEPAK